MIRLPRNIHRIWIGGKKMPDEFIYYGKTWLEHHEFNWHLYLWTDDNIPPLINQECYDSESIVTKADILKTELLYRMGGIVVDCDMECFKPIDPIMDEVRIFSCGEREGIVGNAIFGATKGHPLVKKLIDNIPISIKTYKDYGPNIKTGPSFMTAMWGDEPKVKMLPTHYYFPTSPGTVTPPKKAHLFPRSYGLHHWAASWVGKEEKISGVDPR